MTKKQAAKETLQEKVALAGFEVGDRELTNLAVQYGSKTVRLLYLSFRKYVTIYILGNSTLVAIPSEGY
jgi:hypothetical protein